MSDNRFEMGGQGSDDFDLDTFLESFEYPYEKPVEDAPSLDDFDDDDDGPVLLAAPRPLGHFKQPPPPEPDANATMSYAALGEPYPELPFADEYRVPAPRSPSRSRRDFEQGFEQAPPPSASIASPEDYHTIDMHDSGYRIRGGGGKHRHSIIVTIVAILIIGGAVGGLGYFLYNTITALVQDTVVNPITLTASETRAAVDDGMPVLTQWIDWGYDDAVDSFIEQGFNVYNNARYSSDSPDATASAREIVRMPDGVAEEDLTGFFEGSYNAYSIEELQRMFNGAWVLDMTRGDMGSYFKLKLVNLTTSGIDDEILHLLELQGLTGDGVTVKYQGEDARGNTIIQGTKAVDDRVFYWRVAACLFNEVYTIRSLPDQAVYLTCTVATFDFYTTGAEETPASEE